LCDLLRAGRSSERRSAGHEPTTVGLTGAGVDQRAARAEHGDEVGVRSRQANTAQVLDPRTGNSDEIGRAGRVSIRPPAD